MSNPERSLAVIARSQYGLVTQAQALHAGLTLTDLMSRVGLDRLETVHPGVYRMPGAEPTFPQAALAATLAAGEGALASHRTAGALWGYPNVARWREVTLPARRIVTLTGVTVHRSRFLPEEDRATILRVPVTSALRTAFDLTGVYDKVKTDPIFDHGLVHRLFSRAEVEARVDLLRARRQRCTAIEAWLRERPTSARPMGSEFEVTLFQSLDTAGLPRPVPQFMVVLPDGRIRYIDFAYPEFLLGLEPRGFIWHAHRRAWEADQIRDHELIALGWTPLPVVWQQLQEHPDQVAAIIRRSLVARGARL